MAAAIYDITIEQGATFQMGITMTNADGTVFDLSTWTPRSMIRKKYSDANATETFNIAANVVTGVISMSLPPANTANLAAGSYVYDLEIATAANADVRRILQGSITVSPEVTKP